VCELIVGKKVDQALSILEFTPKEGGALRSRKRALGDCQRARDQQNVDEDKLFVNVRPPTPGRTWKRSLTRAHMHATPIHKRTSHLTVIVDERAS